MKQITIFLLLLGLSLPASSQSNATRSMRYHTFSYMGKTGIVDTSGKEILPPVYDIEWLYKNWLLRTDKGATVFNYITGSTKEYEEYSTYHTNYRDTAYARVKEQGRYYLLNQISGSRYDLPADRTNMKAEGCYFYTYDGVKYRFYRQPADTKPVLQVIGDSYQALWADEIHETAFEYIAFPGKTVIRVYDADMRPAKTILIKKVQDRPLENVMSEAIGQRLYPHYPGLLDPPSSRPSQYPCLGNSIRGERNVVYIKPDRYSQEWTELFSTSFSVETNFDKVTLYSEKEPLAHFDVNLATGSIYFPKKYLDKLDMEFPAKKQPRR